MDSKSKSSGNRRDCEPEEARLPGTSECRYLQTGDEAMNDEPRYRFIPAWVALILILSCGQTVLAQGTAFTYQGKLTDAGNPANGNYDMQFRLFDDVSGGSQQGDTITNSSVGVSDGIFIVQLDFGASVFDGSPRYLEIGVRPAGSPDPYVVLSPCQTLASSPDAIRTLSATAADSLSAACVGCVTSSQIQSVQGAQVSGEIPVASVPAGSGTYIQNATSQQASANFNVSGTGTAGTFNATT